MKKALATLLVFCIASIGPLGEALVTTSGPAWNMAGAPPQQQEPQQDEWFTSDQLENLLAPIALYPDPLLAQVLLAATFPEQIDEAARTLRAYGQNYNIDSTWWDVSVKAVAHYPTVLSMMADKIDWTTSVGQAYVNQSTDVMEAIQRLRAQARSLGNLVTTSQQQIVESDGYIYIYPAQPQYIYVPSYDPAIVYFRSPVSYAAPIIFFGLGLAIGAWLNHDFDWGHHRVYYHGWDRGPVWVNRSRPYVRINNNYVNNTYRNVRVNRGVVNRNVNYDSLNRYNNVHRNVNYDNVRSRREGTGARPRPQAQPQPETPRDNKIIRRNVDPRDPRIDANRGRDRRPPGRTEAPGAMRPPETPRPVTRPPETRPGAMRPPETPRPVTRPPETRPGAMRPPETPRPVTRPPETPRQIPQPPTQQPQRQQPPQVQRPQPQVQQPPQVQRPQPRVQRQQPQVQQPPQVQRQQPQVQQPQRQPVFRGGTGPIDSRSASQRGQESRQQQRQPAVKAQPAPAQRTTAQPQPPKGQGRGRDRRPQ